MSLRCQDQDGNTALFFAVSLHNANQMANHSGEKATVQALLKRGAHLDAKNKFGETPLMVAQRTLRNLLVKHGGKENAKNFGKASQSTR
jgi:ankyrin repeat protein